MSARKGDRLRSILTGKVYEVKIIKDFIAVLKSLDGSSQVWTEVDSLNLFYEKAEKGEISKTCALSPASKALRSPAYVFLDFLGQSTTCHLKKVHEPIRGETMGLFPFFSL